MRSLDEMRPKIVELTDAKLDLQEKVERLERNLAERDATIRNLETSLDESKHQNGEAGNKMQEKLAQKDKEIASLQASLADLQKGYGVLQEELDAAHASLKTLEAQRAANRQDTARRVEEIDRLSSSAQSQAEELSRLKLELKASREAQARKEITTELTAHVYVSFRRMTNDSWRARRMKSKTYALIWLPRRKRLMPSASQQSRPR